MLDELDAVTPKMSFARFALVILTATIVTEYLLVPEWTDRQIGGHMAGGLSICVFSYRLSAKTTKFSPRENSIFIISDRSVCKRIFNLNSLISAILYKYRTNSSAVSRFRSNFGVLI